MSDRVEQNRFMDFLLFRSLKGMTSGAEEERVRSWRGADPANETHYEELRALLSLTQEAYRSLPADPGPAPDGWELLHGEGPRPWEGGEDLGAGGRGGREGEREPIPHRRAERGGRWWGTSAAAVAVAVLAFLALWSRPGPAPAPGGLLGFGVDEFVTGSQDVATVQLRDGTVVRLAPGSRLRLTGSEGQRAVTLEGRAYFAVAPMEGHPFVVHTGGGEAVVLGTRFEVEARGQALRLMVVEGSVALASAGSRLELQAGEMARSVEGAVSAPVKVADPLAALDWVGDFLVFQGTPVAQVAAEIEGRFGVPIRVLGGGSANVTAWFADPAPEEVISVVCQVLAARCSIENHGATIDLTGV